MMVVAGGREASPEPEGTDMKVQDLIEMLQEFDGEAEVRMATQPNWPLQFDVATVTEFFSDEDIPEGPCPDHGVEACEECLAEMFPKVVYVTQGDQPRGASPYAPGALFR
jgi:hypothetical protein